MGMHPHPASNRRLRFMDLVCDFVQRQLSCAFALLLSLAQSRYESHIAPFVLRRTSACHFTPIANCCWKNRVLPGKIRETLKPGHRGLEDRVIGWSGHRVI